MNRPYPSRATSCQECQKRKKGCTREVSGCSGCRSKGIRCIYPRHTQSSELTPESRTAQNVPNTSNWNDDGLLQWDPSADAVGPITVACPITPAFALTQAMTMLEAPILDKDDLDLALEDPDLMPTFEDFECVLTFMTTNPRAGTLMVLMNVNQFLLTFFTQPASLRLVIGAIAACYTRSAISDDTVLWFFKRARKAVILSADRPSLATAKAYYWIFIFAWIMKKYELGFPFLKMAVGLVSVLRLDVDPDYLPDLVGHSEAEKEERRRLFWALCIASWFALSRSLDSTLIYLSSAAVKPLGPVEGVFKSVPSCKPFCDVLCLIVDIKRHYAKIPVSLDDIITSPELLHLQMRFATIQSSIPSEQMMSMESPQVFASTLLANDNISDVYSPWMNANLFACVTLLNRSKLYLTALSSYHPTLLPSSTCDIIIGAVKQSLLAICGAVSLVGVLSNMNDYDRFRVTTHAPFWYPLFEISITAWFMTCRMSEEWKQIVEIDLNMLIDSIQSLTKFVEITMREGLAVEPIGYFMRVMLREMRKDLQDGTIETADQLALTGMSTTSDGNYYGYLGLLGVEVGQGLCWKGRNEDTWREFWKQQGMV